MIWLSQYSGRDYLGLSVDKERHIGDQKSAIMIGIALDFVRVSWEGGLEVVDMVLSLTAPESDRISQHCQKGVTGCKYS